MAAKIPAPTTAPRPSWTVLPALSSWAEPPPTVLEYLIRKFPRIPAETWLDRMQRGLVIEPDGSALAPDAAYRPHLKIGYFRELAHEITIPFEAEILFQSEHLLVVDKPPFLPVVPSGRFVNECLIYRVERQTGRQGITPIHRLDRLTSGLVMLSDRPEALAAYGQLFKIGSIEKIYRASCIVPEAPQISEWTVESLIGPGEPWFRRRSRPANRPGETPNSKTHVQLTSWAEGIGRFRLRPVTGKTHQLRVHMESLGYPILRDPLYPVLMPEKADDFGSPMALLAQSLRFTDPLTGKPVRFQSNFTLESLEAAERQ